MDDDFKFFLISGKARHGKTTLANMMADCYRDRGVEVVVTSYAKYIKMYATELTSWDGNPDSKPRELLQQMGTDIRKKFGKRDFFIKRLDEDLDIYKNYVNIVFIDDARMPIEIDYFKEKYGSKVKCINILRPNFENDLNILQRAHETEVGLDNYDTYDYTIVNDKSLDDLCEKARDLVGRIEN